jgi:hypothetical protein
MPRDGSAEITVLLRAWGAGDREALNRLIPLVHYQLRRMALRRMAQERPGNNVSLLQACMNCSVDNC